MPKTASCMTTKNFLIILSFLSLFSCEPSGLFVENPANSDTIFSDLPIEKAESVRGDTIKSIFRILDRTKITSIEMSNFQFDEDTGLTSSLRHLNKYQILELCKKINGFKQIDSVIDYCSYPHKLKYSLLINYKDKETERIDVLFNLLDQCGTTMASKAVKKIVGNQYFDTLWANAMEPICDCAVIVDGEKIGKIDSIRKKYKVDIIEATIRKDSGEYFTLDLWSSIDSGKEMKFASVLIKKNDHIKTMMRMYYEGDTLFLRSAPFNSANVIGKIEYSPKLFERYTTVKNCYKGWLFVNFEYKGKIYSGWTRNYCSNPYTTCS
jgi:hypothetical protein